MLVEIWKDGSVINLVPKAISVPIRSFATLKRVITEFDPNPHAQPETTHAVHKSGSKSLPAPICNRQTLVLVDIISYRGEFGLYLKQVLQLHKELARSQLV